MIAHRWPGITPMNVYGMQYRHWLRFVDAAKDYVRSLEEQQRQAERLKG